MKNQPYRIFQPIGTFTELLHITQQAKICAYKKYFSSSGVTATLPSIHKNVMLSSRIFVKGLPPSLTEEDFKKHFSSKQEITDAKLIPHRRIGYVGFKSPEEATKAVRYFNKTFIRLSRIGVELAKPVCLVYLRVEDIADLGVTDQR